MRYLYLSNAGISDTIPQWFESISSHISYMDLSYNQIGGSLPRFDGYSSNLEARYLILNTNKFEGSFASFPANVKVLDLSDNLLSGLVPHTDETMNPRLESVNLSKNRFTGSFPVHFCKILSLGVLDLSHNKFSGGLPGCLGNLNYLRVLDLTNNTLTGTIPKSLGNLKDLWSLHLANNIFVGYLPESLQSLIGLVTMDLGNNLFDGSIPLWIGEKLLNLRILNMQSNKFTGKIPLQLCQLNTLQHLNLAHNKIFGTIPLCFKNLSGMIMDEEDIYNSGTGNYEENILASTKGIQLMYTTTLQYLTSLDLSSNNISGEIPDVLMDLVGLKNLNLSRNLLQGQIPTKIGNLKKIESLDLSLNSLSGPIPPTLTNLNFLSALNLSFNNLSGAIPVGNQIQTLDDPSIYEGNNGLCGPPVSRRCKENDATDVVGDDKGHDDTPDLWFYIGMGSGFVVGTMGLIGSLYFTITWRVAYFNILESVYDWFMVSILLTFGRLRREFF
uniref:receptor-like protein EIX2 n=1 Tax=Erigeron canadensis TaxID=72917 RepID=UPI001CB9C3B4|nr:receptor-like protein EIX2 [Erigeron canadensis]